MLTSPESPTFLLQRGRYADANSAAESLWGLSYKGELYGAAGSARDAGKEGMQGDLEAAGAAAKDAAAQVGESASQGMQGNTEGEGVTVGRADPPAVTSCGALCERSLLS